MSFLLNPIRWFAGLSWLGILSVLAMTVGCSAAKPKPITLRFGPSESLQTYRKVLLLPPRPDPRVMQPKLLARLRAMGFEVEAVTRENRPYRSQGTAFFVDREGHLLTSARVLGGHKQATVWVAGTNHDAHVVRLDEKSDLALLKMDSTAGPWPEPVPFSSGTNYSLGQDVFTIGFPLSDILGSSPRMTKGLVSATVGLNDDPRCLQVSVDFQPGNGGGPLLNSRGEVMGIIRSTLNPLRILARTGGGLPQNVNFAVKGVVVRDFLERAGVPAAALDTNAALVSLDSVKDSVVMLKAGRQPSGQSDSKEMICRMSYAQLNATEFRLRHFTIAFFDSETGRRLFVTGLREGEKDNTEDDVMDRATEEIREAFFPAPSKSRRPVTP